MYKEPHDHHAIAVDVTPKVRFALVNGDTAKFVFPIYNIRDGEEPTPIDISGKKYRIILDNAPSGFSASATLDNANYRQAVDIVYNGIRVVFVSHILKATAEKIEWPVVVPYNLLLDDESISYGEIYIEYAPYEEEGDTNA